MALGSRGFFVRLFPAFDSLGGRLSCSLFELVFFARAYKEENLYLNKMDVRIKSKRFALIRQPNKELDCCVKLV